MTKGTAMWTRRTLNVYRRITVEAPEPDERYGMVVVQQDDLPRLMKMLGDDLRDIEKALAEAERGIYPKWCDDDKELKQDLQGARLIVWGAMCALVTANMANSGMDSHAIASLGAAINSAATGSGVEYKNLQPVRKVVNSLSITETNIRAKVAALADLFDDDRAKMGALYDAAAALLDISRPQVQRFVNNVRSGNINDATFHKLHRHWIEVFGRMDDLSEFGIEDLLTH